MANQKIIDLTLATLPLDGTELIEISEGGAGSRRVAISAMLDTLYNDGTPVIETTVSGFKSNLTNFIIQDNSDNDVLLIEDAGTVYLYTAAEMQALKAEKIIDGKGNYVRVTLGDFTNGISFEKAPSGSVTREINFLSGVGVIQTAGTPVLTFSGTSVILNQDILHFTSGSLQVIAGTGDPENNVTANIGSLFLRSDGGADSTLYVKESGNGANTGWVAK